MDPLGKDGRIRWWTDSDGVTQVRLEASFAVYGAEGQNVSPEDLEHYRGVLETEAAALFAAQFSINGQSFNIIAVFSASTYGSEADAVNSGSDNIVELGYDGLEAAASNNAAGVAGGVVGENFGRMAARIMSTSGLTLGTNHYARVFAHEIGAHLLNGLHNNTNNSSFFFGKTSNSGNFLQEDFERLIRNEEPSGPPGNPKFPSKFNKQLSKMAADPPFKSNVSLSPGGLEERKPNSRNNSSPADLYKWQKRN